MQLLLLFYLSANGVLPGGSGTAVRHSTQGSKAIPVTGREGL
jgi:hypothetical protein